MNMRLLSPLRATVFLTVASLSVFAGIMSMAAPAHAAFCDLTCAITAGDKVISDQKLYLTNLSTRITSAQNLNHVTSSDASALQADVSANQSSLDQAKTQIDAATTVASAQQAIQNVYTSLRIYTVVGPRDYGKLWRLMVTSAYNRLNATLPALQATVNHLPSDKKTEVTPYFTDFQTQLGLTQTNLATATSLESSLTVANRNSSPSTYGTNFAQYTKALALASGAMAKAISDLNQITLILSAA